MTIEYFVSLLAALILAGLVQAGAQALLLAYLLRTRRRRTGQPPPTLETLAGTPSSPVDSKEAPPTCFQRTFRYEDGHLERRDYWSNEPNPWNYDRGQELYAKARLVEIKDDPK